MILGTYTLNTFSEEFDLSTFICDYSSSSSSFTYIFIQIYIYDHTYT